MDLDCCLRRVMELIVTMERGKLVAEGERASGITLEAACAACRRPSLMGDTSVKKVWQKARGRGSVVREGKNQPVNWGNRQLTRWPFCPFADGHRNVCQTRKFFPNGHPAQMAIWWRQMAI